MRDQLDQDAIALAATDAHSGNELVVAAFLAVVERRLATPERWRRLADAIASQADDLVAAHADWLVDDLAASNLRLAAVVLATYRTLHDAMPRAELLALLHEAFVSPLGETIREGTAHWLDQVPDPFVALVELSKSREGSYFGASFTFEHPRDDDAAHYADVRRCLWHSFFVAEGAPELTPIFCAFDESWIAAIAPERHGVRFDRATTLGRGGRLCPFHFFRVTTAVAR